MKNVIFLVKKILTAIAIPVILFLVVLIVAPDRVSMGTVTQLLQLSIAPTILAWGVMFSLKVGVWDFSVGALVMFAGIMGGNISNMLGWGIPGVLLFCPLFGILMGLVTGSLFRFLKIPSVVVSVGMLLAVESLCCKLFDGGGVAMSSDIYSVGMFPMNLIIFIVFFAIVYYLFNLSKFGYHVRAIGNGIAAAQMNGINIDLVRVLCFAATGFFAGGYAVMQLGFSGVVLPKTNMASMSVVFDAIMCVFIANALERSVDATIGIPIGALSVQFIKTGILLVNFPTMYQQIVIALFLLLFLAMDTRGHDISRFFNRLIYRVFGRKQPVTE